MTTFAVAALAGIIGTTIGLAIGIVYGSGLTGDRIAKHLTETGHVRIGNSEFFGRKR